LGDGDAPGQDVFLVPLLHLHVQAQALKLADEDVDGFGQARGEVEVALDDGLVDLGPALDVVGFDGQELLEVNAAP
jgi:hypothetical protein